MYMLEDVTYEATGHAIQRTLRSALLQNFRVAHGLHDSHVMLFLILPDFPADTHTGGKEFEKLIVHLIYLPA